METSAPKKPTVTIVAVPRERFSYTQESLESIYRETDYPFELVYVDGGSPQHIKRYLEKQAEEKHFTLIRTPHYLSPNLARNMGLKKVKTKYVVFIDNDVVVTPGWLDKLVQCAEETDAAIVGPLIYIGKPEEEVIHNAGGEWKFLQKGKEQKTTLHAFQNIEFEDIHVSQIRDRQKLKERIQCSFVEFHCVLVRTELFENIGLLDEKLLSTREHIDLCLMADRAGGTVYCERNSIVTYVTGPRFDWWDITYYMLRWSDAWDLASLERFREKWDLADDRYFAARYRALGKRRYNSLLRALVLRFPFSERKKWFADWLKSVERPLNNFISDAYARKHDYANHSLGLRQKDKLSEQPQPLKVVSVSN